MPRASIAGMMLQIERDFRLAIAAVLAHAQAVASPSP